MTTSSCVLNGADLDDCCSNVFALTDLCGLKWKKFVHAGHKLPLASLLEDPILSSFSAALAQDILCSWRSISAHPDKPKHDSTKFSSAKELWVFWYGDEPSLNGIVSTQLRGSSSGCWEDGLPHEPRCMLFRALHNLLERCLLSKRFVRLGKWFLKPSEKENGSRETSEHPAFSFSFFVHGESTVCTAVEIQNHPQVRPLLLEDLALAATRPEGLQVSLSPYGLNAFLTGQVYHADNAKTNVLLEEWHKFYPLDTMPSWNTTTSSDQEMPVMVVAVHDDVQMIYPSAYVMVNYQDEDDSLAPCTDVLPCAPPPSSSSVSLTPPVSPSDPITTDASKPLSSAKLPPSPFLAPLPGTCTPLTLPKGSLSTLEKKKLTQTLVQDVWHDIAAPKPLPSKLAAPKLVGSFMKPEPSTMPSPGGEVNLIGQPLWEFEEPFKRNSCSCTSSSNISRPKPPPQVRSSFGIGRPIPSPSHPLPSPQQQQQQQTQTTMKLKKEKKKPIIPFHHRPLLDKDTPDALKCHVAMATKGLPTVNILTSVNQKRHSDAAGAYFKSKKYSIPTAPGQTAFQNVNPSPGVPQKPSENTAPGKNSCVRNTLDITDPSACHLNAKVKTKTKENIPVKVEPCSWETSALLKPAQRKERIPYRLPKVGIYELPTLPGNPLDSRPLISTMPSPTKPNIISPISTTMEPVFWDSGSKRPSTDVVDPEVPPSPAKRIKREPSTKGTGPGRPRADSSSGGRPGRRRSSSSHQSPTVPFPPGHFASQIEEMEMDALQPLLKSPPPGRAPKPRRHSSTNSNVMSPSVPSPAPIEQPKAGRAKQRRQSIRKQQQQMQEEKERQLREQEEERQRHEQQKASASFDSSMSKILPSPPTPRTTMPINLITEQDLAVTEYDLDHIFDMDDDDDGGGMMSLGLGGGGGGTSGGQGSYNRTADPYNGSSQTMVNPGVVTSHDLARMFPTPPSLETTAHSPPCSAGSEYVSPGSVKAITTMATSPEAYPLGLIMTAEGVYERLLSPKELGPVFEVKDYQEFPLSSTFGPVDNLPSSKKPAIVIPDTLSYKASWQIKQKTEVNSVLRNERTLSAEQIQADTPLPIPSPAISGPFADPRSISSDSKHYTALSPASPASSISSFSTSLQLAKLPSRSLLLPGKITANLPKAHSLSRILALSDSNMNYFYDKNFDSVNLCTCDLSVSLKKSDHKGGKSRKVPAKRQDLKKCLCGSAVLEGQKFSKGLGLFPEDEVTPPALPVEKGRHHSLSSAIEKRRACSLSEIKREGSVSSSQCVTTTTPGASSVASESPFSNLVDIVIDQCSSPFSCSMLKYQMPRGGKAAANSIAAAVSKAHDSSATPTVSSTASVGSLHSLRQIMQEALQKSTSRKTWEQPNGTMVQGPLSWKQLHSLAVKGAEETPKAQPIPSMLVGCGGDWMSLSPFAFQFWDKLLLEPFSTQRDVAYVVVAPENDSVISSTKLFFRELSSIYETCRLGQHVPIAKLRDGILRVGQKFLKLSKESVDDWFTQQSTTGEGARLKLYAQVCRYQLAPYLSTLTLDRHLLDKERSDDKPSATKSTDGDRSGFPYSGGGEGTKTGTIGTPTSDSRESCHNDDDCENTSDDPPTIVVYLLDPFSSGGSTTGSGRTGDSDTSYVGMLRCFAEMSQGLSDAVRNNVVFQVVPLQQVFQVETLTKNKESTLSFIMQLKCLAFSVFSRCRKTLHLNVNAKSLTGFGPAAGHEASLKGREVGAPYRVNQKPLYTQFIGSKTDGVDTLVLKLYSSPYILDTPLTPIDQTEDSPDKMSPTCRDTPVMYCGYCLSRDQRWLLTSCTDGTGEMIETTAISVDPPLRADGRPHKFPSRTKALRKVWEFCLGVIAPTLSPWRIVICKMGRMGQGELRDWKEILSKTSMESRDPVIRDSCKACHTLHSDIHPTVLGASVIMLEPEPAVRLYMARGLTRPPSPFDSGHATQTPVTTIPKPDVSRTYIAVFPTTYHMKGAAKHVDVKTVVTPETTPDTVITDTSILLAGADDDENDPDPLRHLFPILNTSPSPLSPGLLASPLADENHLRTSSPMRGGSTLNSSPGVQVHSPFQPIARASPFQPVSQPAVSPCLGVATPQDAAAGEEDAPILLPLAQGYVISTLRTGKMPNAFWANYPQAEKLYPAILRGALCVHTPDLHEPVNGFTVPAHALGSQIPCDVLRYVLQRFDALSWLTVDPVSRDRRSCLPVHLCMLAQLHDAFSVLLDTSDS